MSRRRGPWSRLVWQWSFLFVVAAQLGGCGAGSASTYAVSAQSATIDKRDDNGNCWEPGCGDPRTYVCVTLAGTRACSTSRASTAPQWFEELLPAADGDALRRGVTVDYKHGSGAAGDATICHQNVLLTDMILGAGHFDLPCGGSIVVTLGLRAN